MKKKYSLEALQNLELPPTRPLLVFLYGAVGLWKTTWSSLCIAKNIGILPELITSPTYVYYNRYQNIYHFDLYRLKDYEEFVSIWGEEILDNNDGIILIEWPEILEKYYIPDVKIIFSPVQGDENLREIEVLEKAKQHF